MIGAGKLFQKEENYDTGLSLNIVRTCKIGVKGLVVEYGEYPVLYGEYSPTGNKPHAGSWATKNTPDIATMAKQLEAQGALIQTLQSELKQVIARKTFSFIVANATVQWFLFPAILALQIF